MHELAWYGHSNLDWWIDVVLQEEQYGHDHVDVER
jgi:hypothetical protein